MSGAHGMSFTPHHYQKPHHGRHRIGRVLLHHPMPGVGDHHPLHIGERRPRHRHHRAEDFSPPIAGTGMVLAGGPWVRKSWLSITSGRRRGTVRSRRAWRGAGRRGRRSRRGWPRRSFRVGQNSFQNRSRVDALAALHQALHVGPPKRKCQRRSLEDLVPGADAGDRRVHQHQVGDAVRLFGDEGVGDHVADVVGDHDHLADMQGVGARRCRGPGSSCRIRQPDGPRGPCRAGQALYEQS